MDFALGDMGMKEFNKGCGNLILNKKHAQEIKKGGGIAGQRK